ncbi:hypothetical protein [Niallia circulans]|uniref:hypothetical protein n=1 Tax=Niallia circulans TaxID=1397 RepID=UPI0026E9A35F|nr:hypothetical protein [Niallia circulans]
MGNPFECLSEEQEQMIAQYVEGAIASVESPDVKHLPQSGVMFPDRLPSEWQTLPDEWDNLMDTVGIVNLHNHDLEKYLEKWLRLLGYAYWVRGVREGQKTILERAASYVKDYIFAHASGSREQKSAVAGSHPLYKKIMDELVKYEERVTMLSGMVYKWEKIEFTISRAISRRSV